MGSKEPKRSSLKQAQLTLTWFVGRHSILGATNLRLLSSSLGLKTRWKKPSRPTDRMGDSPGFGGANATSHFATTPPKT